MFVKKQKPRADDFLARDWEKAQTSVEERIRRKSRRNRWFDNDDLKTVGLILLGILLVLLIGWGSQVGDPELRDPYIEDPRR